MKRCLERLADTDPDETPATDDADASSVEWTDLSTRTAGPIGTAERHERLSTDAPDSSEPSSAADAVDSDRLLSAVLETLTEPTMLVDHHGEITHLSSTACTAFETTEADALGAEPHELHGGEPLARTVVASGEPIVDQYETVAVGEATRMLRRRLTPVIDDGEAIAAVETTRVVAPTDRPVDRFNP